jgi:hypothetical protein
MIRGQTEAEFSFRFPQMSLQKRPVGIRLEKLYTSTGTNINGTVKFVLSTHTVKLLEHSIPNFLKGRLSQIQTLTKIMFNDKIIERQGFAMWRIKPSMEILNVPRSDGRLKVTRLRLSKGMVFVSSSKLHLLALGFEPEQIIPTSEHSSELAELFSGCYIENNELSNFPEGFTFGRGVDQTSNARDMVEVDPNNFGIDVTLDDTSTPTRGKGGAAGGTWSAGDSTPEVSKPTAKTKRQKKKKFPKLEVEIAKVVEFGLIVLQNPKFWEKTFPLNFDPESEPKVTANVLQTGILDAFLLESNLENDSFCFHGTQRKVVLKSLPQSLKQDKVYTLEFTFSPQMASYFDFPVDFLTSQKDKRELRTEVLDLTNKRVMIVKDNTKYPLHILSPSASAAVYTTLMGLVSSHVGMANEQGSVSNASVIQFPNSDGEHVFHLLMRDQKGNIVAAEEYYELNATFEVVTNSRYF